MPAPKSVFTGDLKTPIKLEPSHKINAPTALTHSDGAVGVEKWWKDHEAKEAGMITIERARKNLLLFAHYGLDPMHPDAWQNLAVKLACDCVPGFEVIRPEKEGAKTIWTDIHIALLWFEVEKQVKSKRQSASQACMNLAGKAPWKKLLVQSKTRSSVKSTEIWKKLYKVYGEQSRHSPFVTLFNNATATNSESFDTLLDLFLDGFKNILDTH